jgi:uncharacterized FlgJ-related protein
MTTEEKVYKAAIDLDVPKSLALLIVAQSKHETGGYTSNAFHKDNNLFGYKYVGQKIATPGIKSSESDHYAHYTSVEDSVLELVNWIKRRITEGRFPSMCNIKTKEHYASLLKAAGYFGAPQIEYVNGLNHWYKSDIA